MKITIVQAEIEQAIIDFIKGQVDVKEGMEINIDLRATRGAEGYQADIDIRPRQGGTDETKGAPPADKPQPAADKPPLDIEAKVQASKPRTVRAPAKPKADEATSGDDANKGTQDQNSAIDAEETAAEATGNTDRVKALFESKEVSETENAETAPTDQPAPKSIFGTLARPVNA